MSVIISRHCARADNGWGQGLLTMRWWRSPCGRWGSSFLPGEVRLKVLGRSAKPKAAHAGGKEWLVYVVTRSGHRQSYLDILGPMFDLEPVSGRMTIALFRRLLRAERLLFAT